jgi:hypothetical protein
VLDSTKFTWRLIHSYHYENSTLTFVKKYLVGWMTSFLPSHVINERTVLIPNDVGISSRPFRIISIGYFTCSLSIIFTCILACLMDMP